MAPQGREEREEMGVTESAEREAAIRDGFEQDHLVDAGVPERVGWCRSDGTLVRTNILSAARAKAERWEAVYAFRLPHSGREASS